MSREKVVNGFRVLRDRPVTQSEMAWIEMLRTISDDEVPGPTLRAVQALRVVMGSRSSAEKPLSRSPRVTQRRARRSACIDNTRRSPPA